MKSLCLSTLLALSASISMSSAATISLGTYAFGDRNTAYDQNIESESGSVLKSGSVFNYNVDAGATPWGSGTWLFSSAPGYVEVAFSALADTLFVQFQADSNDGIAEFIVDGMSVGTYNTFNQGWHQVKISGLSLAAHTLRVNRVTADLAFDNFLAANNTPVPAVPLPAGGLLLLTGFAGIAGLRRLKKTAK